MLDELKRMRDVRKQQAAQMRRSLSINKPKIQLLETLANELDTIIRKYDEPTEAMLDAGIEALPHRYDLIDYAPKSHREVYRREMRACFKAMMNAED